MAMNVLEKQGQNNHHQQETLKKNRKTNAFFCVLEVALRRIGSI